jgi:M-phase inducer tyrosine phosphatase
LNNLLDGVFDSKLTSYHIIDCRFDYEYNGGHIPGALNINTTAAVEEFLLGTNALKPKPSISGDASGKTVLIFHCEFSAKRAPTLYVSFARPECIRPDVPLVPSIYALKTEL